MITEYVLVTCLVALGAALAVSGLGLLLMETLFYQQALLLLPIP